MNPQAGEILVFNKPYRWTSFNVVAKVRGELSHRLGVKKLKVGHAGTLDPLATGVLIICTGKSTKFIDELQAHTKEYVATIKLGATTPSFDMETSEDATYPTEHIAWAKPSLEKPKKILFFLKPAKFFTQVNRRFLMFISLRPVLFPKLQKKALHSALREALSAMFSAY